MLESKEKELKFKDIIHVFNPVPVVGVVTDTIVGVTQGVMEQNRIGRKIFIKHVSFKINIILPQTTNLNDGNDAIRLIVFVDKQTNGATAQTTAILRVPGLLAHYDLPNRERFNIMYDETWTLNASAAEAGASYRSQQNKQLDFAVNVPIDFTGPSGNVTAITSNNISFLLVSENAAAEFNVITRVRFQDE